MWLPPQPLSDDQLAKLKELEALALSLNEKLNLYSRTSAGEFKTRHLAHSLALATHSFPPDSDVVDWGTGGGMPGLVLAIVFPNVRFHLVDAVAKKIQAVKTMARRLDLKNVSAYHTRAERWEGEATHSVSRATAPLLSLWLWHIRVAKEAATTSDSWPAGLICLKGGELQDEIAELKEHYPSLKVTVQPLPAWFEHQGMVDKQVVVVTA